MISPYRYNTIEKLVALIPVIDTFCLADKVEIYQKAQELGVYEQLATIRPLTPNVLKWTCVDALLEVLKQEGKNDE